MNTDEGQVPHNLSREKAEFTFQPDGHLPIIKVTATHKEFAEAFKHGYLKGFKLLWLELYTIPEQQCRVVIVFPTREIEILSTLE